MSLAALVSKKKWTEFEDAWTELMVQEGPTEAVFAAIEMAADKKQIQRCVPLVREHADLLRAGGRSDEAARLLGAVMLAGGNPGELAGLLYEAASEAWSGEPWWETYTGISGLAANAPDMRASWRLFDRCLAIGPGVAVFHGKGWGIGLIEGLTGEEADVRFKSGRRDHFPFSTAIDIFEILGEKDMRGLAVRDPDELARLVREEPLEVLRNVLQRFRGKAAYPVIKGALSQLGVDGTSFSGWWRKARKQAEASEWFDVSGTSTKAQIQVLASATDPADGIRRSLRMVGNLAKALVRVRDLLSGGHVEESVKQAALETIEEMSNEADAGFPERFGAWMLLRDQRGETPEVLLATLAQAAAIEAPEDPSQPPELWRIFGMLANTRDQERCVGLLAELYVDASVRREEMVQHLQHAAPGMVRPLVAELLEAERHADLAELYGRLLSRPTRNPNLLAHLADQAENDRISADDWPIPAHRIQSLFRLAVHLEKHRIGNTALARAQTRLTSVLTGGTPSVLRRLLAGANATLLRSTLNIAERGVDAPLENELIALIAETAPELFREGEKPFWETGLWTTRAGLQRRQAELRELVDVKLPANSEAIGKAASYGDLSENSEWEAAIEDQRNLTQRAQDIEAEIRSAQVLEEVSLPEDTVAPGTAVRFKDLGTGELRLVKLLGPWDEGDDDTISYRAPLAAGLLGLSTGGRATIVLPSGELEAEVLSIEPLPLG